MNMILISVAGSAVCASLFTCIASIYKRDTQKSVYFNLLTIAVVFYLIGNFLEITSVSIEAATVGLKMSYLGRPFIPALWYLCVREYCGQKTISVPMLLGVMLVPVVVMILAFTWEQNHFLFESFQYNSDKQISQLDFTPGPFYMLKQFCMYFFNILGLFTIITSYMQGTNRFRQQAVFFIISILIPISTTSHYLVNIESYWVDITPYILALAIVLFFLALHKYGIANFSSVLKDSVITNLHEGVILFDKDGVYMDSNDTIKEIFPKIKDIRLGTKISEMEYLPFNKVVLSASAGRLQEFTKEAKGCIRTYSISISNVKQNNAAIGYSVIIYNITPFKNLMSELEVKAHMDSLTKIYNRGFFFEKSNYEAQQAKRANNPLSLIMFDLDHFKRINDRYGHPYGDYVLTTVASIGMQSLRKTDIFGRYGGEEFCILLPNTNIEGARLKAETIRQKIQTYIFEHEKIQTSVTASFGVADFNKFLGEEALEQMLKQADANLYKAKESGRNKVVSG